jgi:hypothetical protein
MAFNGRIEPNGCSAHVNYPHDAVSVEHLAVDCEDVAAIGVTGKDQWLRFRNLVDSLMKNFGLFVKLAS